MKSYSSREVLKRLFDDGWYVVACVGNHYQLKHPVKPGKVTLPYSVGELPARTLKIIEKQFGIQFD